MERQQTVARAVQLDGVGLHHGQSARLVVAPAPPDSGLVFVRDDLGGLEIPALQQFRAPMVHASRLMRDGQIVDTPEHLLAAVYALGIDNARLHLTGPEIPILDGSSLPFARALLDAGFVAQDAPRAVLTVVAPVVVGDEGRRLEILPGEGLRVTAGIDFEHEHLGYQELTVRLDEPEDFLAKLAPARTFAMKRDVDKLQAIGLARGGSLDNAILVDDDGVKGIPLRYADEFVRHKLLDLVGDLALIGCRVRGRVVAWRAGHALHGRLVDAILAGRERWVFEGGAGAPTAQPMPPVAPRS